MNDFGFLRRSPTPLVHLEARDKFLPAGKSGAIEELARVFDKWELALWFVQANAWLHVTAPIERLEDDEAAILQAAEAQRVIARG